MSDLQCWSVVEVPRLTLIRARGKAGRKVGARVSRIQVTFMRTHGVGMHSVVDR